MEHETGARPVICFNDRNTVVQFRTSWGSDNDLWYYVGTIDKSGVITWEEAERPDWYGRNCRVAINNEGTVVEMHQSLTQRRIYSRVGVVKEGKISWGECQRVEDGMKARPSQFLTRNEEYGRFATRRIDGARNWSTSCHLL